jgi:uncharacterized protein involved in type VI secretion and phage assembly
VPETLIEAAAQLFGASERRNVGVAVATVVDNIDASGQGRVQIELPWMPELLPWARVASFSAGSDRGAFFIPQAGDEVLVAFQHGDVREPFVIGSLWNGRDLPPAKAPTDAITKRLVRTPAGHEIELDDAAQSITITSTTDQKVRIEPSMIELTTAGDTAKVKLDTAGNIELSAALGITLKASTIALEAATIDVKASANANVEGGASCSVQAPLVRIN